MKARFKDLGKTWQVDVAHSDCVQRPCFRFGFDKGTFVQGRGYTSYHKKERPVCMERHLNGCPINSVCPECRTVTPNPVGSPCERPWCRREGSQSLTIALKRGEARDDG